MLHVWADAAGRIVVAEVKLYRERGAIVSVYATKYNYDKRFHDTLTQKMLDCLNV